jgi:hypothetical protein
MLAGYLADGCDTCGHGQYPAGMHVIKRHERHGFNVPSKR